VLAQRKRWFFSKLRVYKVCSLVNKDIIFVIHKYAKIISYMLELITKAKKSMVIVTLFWGLLVCQIVCSMQEIVVKAKKSMVVLK
jgi:sugar-specific transcriptional regulator TrmB